jgi:hypothetical protein
MNCAFDKEKLTGYYDGELEAAEKAEVERHIASCSECLRELGELKSAAILVKELPRLRAPRSIAEGVSREIQAAGRVHSFAKFRRSLLWGSAVAAALFIGLNVMYFTQKRSAAPEAVALKLPSAVPPIGRMESPRQEVLEKSLADPAAASRADRLAEGRDRAAAVEESRKSLSGGLDQKEKPKVADAAMKEGEAAQAGARAREKAAAPVTKAAEKVASEPAPAPTLPPAAAKPQSAAPGAAPAREEAKRVEAPADKAPTARKDGDSFGKADEEQKQRRSLNAEPPADAGPAHLTLASTQISKTRQQVEAALKKLGIPLPPQPRVMRGVKDPALDAETTFALELTDSQLARLQQELNQPGSSQIFPGKPDDAAVQRQIARGGAFGGGAKKEGAAVAGAALPRKPAESLKSETSKTDGKERDAKDAQDTPLAGKAAAEGGGEKGGEPLRKLVLHLVEVASLPEAPPAAELKK